MDDKVRMSLTLSSELKEWYVSKSDEYGVSISALMVMALVQYREQQLAIKGLNNIQDLVKELESKFNP